MIGHEEAAPPVPTPESWDSDAEIGGVLIATPCYGGMVTTRYCISAIFTGQELARRGLRWGWATTESESLVQRARNGLAAKMLADQSNTHLVFIDADIEWQPRDVIRLLAHDVDVVCGVYPKKMFPIDYAFLPVIDERGWSTQDPRTGAIEIANAATGFLCIKRGVFERMADAYPSLKYRLRETESEDEIRWTYNFFDCFVDDGILWSEDYGFSRRWRALGGRIWLDPAIRLNHIGSTTYEGDPSRIFRRVGDALPMPQAAE